MPNLPDRHDEGELPFIMVFLMPTVKKCAV